MKKIKIIAALLIVTLSTASCTDAARSKMGGYGDEFTVELINCDGTTARSWVSSGKVQSEKGSDGYYFSEKGTGTLIEVTGPIIITKN